MKSIKKERKFNLIINTFLAFTLLNIIDIPITTNVLNTNINLGQQALAKRGGGRSGGGSFRGRSSNSRSNTRGGTRSGGSFFKRRSPSSSNRRGSSNNTFIFQRNSYGGSYGYGYRLDKDLATLILLIVIFGFFIFIIYVGYIQQEAERDTSEKKNHKIIISRLQVALTAEAKEISPQLSQLILDVDTNTQSGLVELLQESLVILLRNSEHWTHVLSRSFPVKIDQAEAKFNQLSIAQRSKFSRETVSNINGKIRNNAGETNNNTHQNDTLGAYIIVTILVGCTEDKPLFNQIRSSEELKVALEKLATINQESLMKLEVLWTPQSDDESLTQDEFILEYTGMIQLV